MTRNNQSDLAPGIWIGIDLGTTNCACAVWDSFRGSPKWLRLPNNVAAPQHNGKMGRVVPSVVRWVRTEGNGTANHVLVGAAVYDDNVKFTKNGSILQSVKRLLGKSYNELDLQWLKTLDFDVIPPNPLSTDSDNNSNKSVRLVARISGSDTRITTTPEDVLSLELSALRNASQAYLDRYRVKKQLHVPGCDTKRPANVSTASGSSILHPLIRNVVVGVPAHFSHRHIRLVEDACRKAGFEGHVGTCLESTAASMAYGINMQESLQQATILVVDMGGGTTDITIATHKKNGSNKLDEQSAQRYAWDNGSMYSSYQVLVTRGDEALGGEDIDQAIVDFCMKRSSSSMDNGLDVPHLRSKCRQAKEALCRAKDPSTFETIVFGKTKERIVISQDVFEEILQPWLHRAYDLILKAKADLEDSVSKSQIDEVVLVGGTTRIPAIRKMIQEIFPTVQLCTSQNPMSSVAQGLAIQAAIISKQVPIHELKNALMLDCVPHAIGVELPGGRGFLEIIPRNAPLPAQGRATFVLADKYQAGVSIRAVEEVGVDRYEPMTREAFTFLLRRLTPMEFSRLKERSIIVGMSVDVDGKFIVRIFDENDPEQVLRKERFENEKDRQDVDGEIGYINDLIFAESGMRAEQVVLSLALLGVIVVYILVKLSFHDALENGD
jgi:molecular chaperone DnaK (HSP70)